MLRYRRKNTVKIDLPSTAKNLPSCCVTAVKIPSKFGLPSTAKTLPSKKGKPSTAKRLPSCCVTVPSKSVKNIVTGHSPDFFASLKPVIINTFAWMMPEIDIYVSCKHLIVYMNCAPTGTHKLSKAKQVLTVLLGTYSRSQRMRASNLWRSDRGV